MKNNKNSFFSFMRLGNIFRFNNPLKGRFSGKRLFKKQEINKKFFIPLFFTPFMFGKNILFLGEEEDKNKKQDSSELEFKDIIRGEYENKIRIFSPIEKKFLIFSKLKSTEDLKMSSLNFLNCVTPFQYMKTLGEDEIKEILFSKTLFQELFKKIDLNNDQLISFEEFVVWSLMFSVKINDLKEKFPKGTITREQFAEYLYENLQKLNILKITDKALMDARIIKSDHDTIFRTLVEFTSKYFKDVTLNIDKDIQKLIFDMSLIILLYEVFIKFF